MIAVSFYIREAIPTEKMVVSPFHSTDMGNSRCIYIESLENSEKRNSREGKPAPSATVGLDTPILPYLVEMMMFMATAPVEKVIIEDECTGMGT